MRLPPTALLAILVTGFVSLSGCGDPVDDAKEVAESCGDQPCPVGTTFHESRSFSGGYEIGASVDPTTYQASGAYKRFGTGECEYVCQVIQPCPQNTFPVITATCFTCGTLNAQGVPVSVSCGK